MRLLILFAFTSLVHGQLKIVSEKDHEEIRIGLLTDLITNNLKDNGWNTVLSCGNFPNSFYKGIQNVSKNFVIYNLDFPKVDIDDVIPYYPNVIVINCVDFSQCEKTILYLINLPYWHPLANILIVYHKLDEVVIVAKLFFSLWYNKAINVVVIRYDDFHETLLLSEYTPYVDERYDLPLSHRIGCWTNRRITMPVRGFENGLVCEEGCHNSATTKIRSNNLGTCIGFNVTAISYNIEDLRNVSLFEDKSVNLHGYELRSFISESEPFFLIEDYGNGSYRLHARDGTVWNNLAKYMNFTIDLSPNKNTIKEPFNYNLNIEHLFEYVNRKADLYLQPIYVFDLVVIELDYVMPYRDSGVCFTSSRAGFETIIFDMKALKANHQIGVELCACFFGIWITFSIFKIIENRFFSFDQIGKDLLNAFRNVLLLSLHKAPKKESFRIFLTFSIWSCFIINFISQATIISFFTAAKRGKEVDTFDEIVEKGYNVEGMASPDVILPETEENFRIINSRLVPQQNLYQCVERLRNDTHRFCLTDCSVGRYLEKNWLNDKGEQYLHIAQDRIHSHYLTIINIKHSPLTSQFTKYVMRMFEAGLIQKWEQYRFSNIKGDALLKPLGIEDLSAIFELYCMCVGFTFVVFLLELATHYCKSRMCFKSKENKGKNLF